MSYRKPFLYGLCALMLLLGTVLARVVVAQITPSDSRPVLVPASAPPTYTPPSASSVLAGKAPLRLLVNARQTMLAWKGNADVRIINPADGATLYTAKSGEMVGIVYDETGTTCQLRQNGKNFCTVPTGARLASEKPVKVWTPSPDAWQSLDAPIVIFPVNGSFNVAREIVLEAYLRNVVPGEMPSSFHPQALLAQAIIARTYALIKLGRHAAEGADVCATVHCQVYGGKRAKETDKAISDTRGLVLMAGEKLAEPYYSACCGGVTDDAGLLWGPEYDRPYLAGVPDMPSKSVPNVLTVNSILNAGDAYCKGTSASRWSRQFTAAEVNALVAKNLPLVTNDPAAQIRTVTNMSVEERTPNGRIASLRVEGDGASILVYGDAVRWLFGTGKPGADGLWSALFELTVTRDAAGRITAYTFRGAGRGHGIGLCQWGAQGRAQAGQTCRQILRAYYPGTRLSDEK
ncbi:MAG: SpoIID/LytB domain-containing protein [Armatimonadota bacterium]